jgi:acetylornithine deacetylase/succinyl-diaminopimelate desuccinylase
MFNVKDYYDKEELIKLTQELIRIPSHKDIPNQEKDVGDYIYNFCKENDIEVELQNVVDERNNVIAYIRGNGTGPSIMFNGHMDTVTPYEMIIDPFKAEVKDGYIWGRGAVDMKGSLASMLIMMLAMKRANFIPKGDVIFTGVIGEEGKSEGTEYIVNSNLTADAAIVGEPSGYEYAIGHRGLEWFDIIVKGKASHSGTPEKGINAIEKAMDFIHKVKVELYPKLKKRHNDYMGDSIMNFGTIHGGTGQSTVADHVIIRIDRRYIPGETVESVMDEYREIIESLKKEDPNFDAEIRITPESELKLHHPPLITSSNQPIVYAVRDAVKSVINREPRITRGIGWTDAALLKTYGKISTVVLGPGDLSLAHTEDERVLIQDLINAVEINARIVDNFCNNNLFI